MKQKLLLIVSFFCINGTAQIINSNKNVVGEFFDGNINNVELNGSKALLQLKIFKTKPTKYNYTRYRDVISAEKNNSFFLNLGITNSNTFVNINKIDFKENNGFIVGLTYQHSFDKIYPAYSAESEVDQSQQCIQNPNNPVWMSSFYFSLNFQQDNFNHYDPKQAKDNRVRPDKISFSWGYSYYIFKYRENAKFKFSLVPTFNFNLNLKTYNEEQLQNFLFQTNTENSNSILLTNATTFDGKYGILNQNIQTARIALSLPFIPKKSFWKFPILSPIPYITYEVFENNKPKINTGFALGILTNSLIGKKNNCSGRECNTFNVPSFLTIGVDSNHQNGISSKPTWFIAGSVKFK